MKREAGVMRVKTLRKEYLSDVLMLGHRSRLRAERMLYKLIGKVDGEPLKATLVEFMRDLKKSNWKEHGMIDVHLDACEEVDGYRYEDAYYLKEVAIFERVHWIHVP